MATIIDGKAIAATIREEVRTATLQLGRERDITPGLAFILVGDNPASRVYVRSKGKACGEMGFFSVTHELPATCAQEEVLALVGRCNDDPAIHGVLVQLPLPPHIHEQAVIEAVDYRKDVDGFHPVNVGRLVLGLDCFVPCTPAGIRELLVRSGNDPGGKHVVVLGRSMIVGKPVANILLQKRPGANAVVTVAHTGASDLSRFTRDADILVAAVGRPGTITGEMIRPGCVVVDVGTNRVPDAASKTGYRIVGDVDVSSVSAVAGAITPVPGGVGPMTIAMLMQNTLRAARGDVYP